MGEIKVAACLCLIVSVMVAAAPRAEAVISCDQVLNSVSACLGFLDQGGGAVAPACCDGVKSLTKAAAATADLQAVCSCTKSLQPRVGAKTEFINALHVQCATNFPYKYSPSIDCSKVKW